MRSNRLTILPDLRAIAAGALLAGALLTSGCAGDHEVAACSFADPGCAARSGWVKMTCPGSDKTALVLSYNPDERPEQLRGQTELGGGIVREALVPGTSLSVVAPVGSGTPGNHLTESVPTPAHIVSTPDPREPENAAQQVRYDDLAEKTATARSSACADSDKAAQAAAASTAEALIGTIGSWSGLVPRRPGDPVDLRAILGAASQFYALQPAARREAIVIGLPLDTPLPPAGFGDIQGSTFVFVAESTGSPGRDRLGRERISAFMTAAGATAHWIDEGYSSPSAVLSYLRP